MRVFGLSLVLILLNGTALATVGDEFFGTPAMLPQGVIMVDGHDLTLWGIDRLAGDQECWHENRPWNCGEQASIALRHHLAGGIPVRCVVKSIDDDKLTALCFSKRDGKEQDIARYLVMQGWARDQHDITGGYYTADETLARRDRRGIWTSRFQSAEDWKNGIQRYVEYDIAPMKTTSAAPSTLPPSDKPQ
jgi:endonuclease YncB( thermonuclease family)